MYNTFYIILISLLISSCNSLKIETSSVTKIIKKESENLPYKNVLKWYDHYFTDSKVVIKLTQLDGSIHDPFYKDVHSPIYDSIDRVKFLKKMKNSFTLSNKDSIINLINSNISCGYRLIDFSIATENDFKVVFASIEFSEDFDYLKIQNSSHQELNEAYYNLGICQAKMKTSLKELVFGVNLNNIEELLYSGKFNEIAVPASLKAEINNILDETRNFLPPDKRNIVINTNIVFEDPRGYNINSNRFLFAEYINGSIYISPFLIRSVLLLAISKHSEALNNFFDIAYDFHEEQEMNEIRNLFLTNYEKRIYSFVIDDIKDSLYFILGHELAHGYLIYDTEEKCDCYSLFYMVMDKGWGYKPFDNIELIINMTIEQNLGDYWGWDESEIMNLKERFIGLNKLKNDVVFFCE